MFFEGSSYDDGLVTYDETEVKWYTPYGSEVIINLSEMVIIGEYTSNALPHGCNWFITFVYRSGEWDNISIDAKGINSLKLLLTQKYGIDYSKHYDPKSLIWRSFIRYPKILENKELFIHPPRKANIVSSSENTSKRRGLFGGWTFFSDEKQEYIQDVTKDKRWIFELTNDAKEAIKNSAT